MVCNEKKVKSSGDGSKVCYSQWESWLLIGFGSDPALGKVGLFAHCFRCKIPKVKKKNDLEDSWVKTVLLIFQTWTLQIIKPKRSVVCGRGQSPWKDAWPQAVIPAWQNQTYSHEVVRTRTVMINGIVCI